MFLQTDKKNKEDNHRVHATVKKILDSGILGIGVLLENDGRPTFAPSVPDRKLEIDTLFSGIGPNFKVVEV